VRPFAALLLWGVLGGPALAQEIVTSAAPDRVAVTVYRNPDRGAEPIDLSWVGGYALISETRRVRLPAGRSELRLEGVTSGIVPQSAIVTDLGGAVIEKNRDARLLSPGSLIAAHLGERVMLRRTSRATGATREEEAIVRASDEGVLIQTRDGIEALRCTGLNETLTMRALPAGLSAKPTLSVSVRSDRPVDASVTLSYISNNFDWQTDYVAELSPDGKSVSLFGWMTLANGDQTGLIHAATQAVAGRLNRERVWVDPGQAPPITINCWPQGKTSDIPLEVAAVTAYDISEEIVVTGMRAAAAPPPPPPPPMPERGGPEPAMMAEEERLGDVRLYRIPEPVTVAARSQKQVALLKQPSVKVATILRVRPTPGVSQMPLQQVLVTRNRRQDGLGLPLPAGNFALFGTRGGRRILLGEGRLDDRTLHEKVEIPVGLATGAFATVVQSGNDQHLYELTLSNDMDRPRTVEVELPLEARASGRSLVRRDGWKLWRATIPANGKVTLRYRYS
jgi:hypothetical protein